MPSLSPSQQASSFPSSAPSNVSSSFPSITPSQMPSLSPSNIASSVPSSAPSNVASLAPSKLSSAFPSMNPSAMKSNSPTMEPTPTQFPTTFCGNGISVTVILKNAAKYLLERWLVVANDNNLYCKDDCKLYVLLYEFKLLQYIGIELIKFVL